MVLFALLFKYDQVLLYFITPLGIYSPTFTKQAQSWLVTRRNQRPLRLREVMPLDLMHNQNSGEARHGSAHVTGMRGK